MKKSSTSLKIKTILYFSVFSIFILLLLWGSQMLFLKVFYEKYQIKELSPIEKEYLNSINKINQIAESLDKK